MNVVDSSAWLSYFADDSNAEIFSQPIEELEKLIVPSITITEVFKHILRQCGDNAALEAVAHMEQGKVIALNGSLAIDAAQYGVELKLPLADSIIYATAQKFDAILWTQDADFKSLDGVKYFSQKS